jgi:hypothetical protein
MAAVTALAYLALVKRNSSYRLPLGEQAGADAVPGDDPDQTAGSDSTHVVYEVVEHDGGFAYKVGDVFSETFATRLQAQDAAAAAARRQVRPGSDEEIEYQDADGKWHADRSEGVDRPETEVRA